MPDPSDIAGVIATKFLSPFSTFLHNQSPKTAEYFFPLVLLFDVSILFRA